MKNTKSKQTVDDSVSFLQLAKSYEIALEEAAALQAEMDLANEKVAAAWKSLQQCAPKAKHGKTSQYADSERKGRGYWPEVTNSLRAKIEKGKVYSAGDLRDLVGEPGDTEKQRRAFSTAVIQVLKNEKFIVNQGNTRASKWVRK